MRWIDPEIALNTYASLMTNWTCLIKLLGMCHDIYDKVRRFQHKIIVGTKAKLARDWTGPWTVIERLSDALYKIQHSQKSKPVVIHADNLKHYRVDATAESVHRNTTPSGLPIHPTVTPAGVHADHPNLPGELDSTGPAPDSLSTLVVKTTRTGRIVRRPQRYLDTDK